MSLSALASQFDVHLHPRRPPMLSADAGGDALGWVAERRDALRRRVAEHGSILIRGLGLRDPREIASVFRRLAASLMAPTIDVTPR